jgi:hypothetical protein
MENVKCFGIGCPFRHNCARYGTYKKGDSYFFYMPFDGEKCDKLINFYETNCNGSDGVSEDDLLG